MNKGFPAKYDSLSNKFVDACSAGLLILKKNDFNDVIFSSDYIFGDFEDADLMMKLKVQGKNIRLVTTPSIYHLERQSIRKLGDHSFKSSITSLNCKIFNDRWGEHLDLLNLIK